MKVIVLVAAVLGIASAKISILGNGQRYDNHHIIDVSAKDTDQAKYFYEIDAAGDLGLDVWRFPGRNNPGRVRVPPESVDRFLTLMKRGNVSTLIKHTDLEAYHQELAAQTYEIPKPKFSGAVNHGAYHSMSVINNYMTGFANSFPNHASVSNLAYTTYDGNSIPILQIIKNGDSANKMNIFIEAGAHAREWITMSSALYFIDKLLYTNSFDSDADFLFSNFNWFVVPVANPDGYTYSRNNDRYWRKNRNSVSGCFFSRGVDLNRNFAANWGGEGSSGSCSSDTYRGTSVFSESESQGLRDKVQAIESEFGRVDAYLSVHSYSEMLLVPYGFQNGLYPSNINAINDITYAAQSAIWQYSGKTYQVGAPWDLLYVASGGSGDWARYTEGILYAMTYELRPSGNQGLGGFVLPESEIEPSGEEFFQSVKAIAENLPA